ncbi:MAG: hypothetical protein AUG07_02020 [Acidobacteria bacterium 13_1_20CM_2_60_10]|nr:MAG: hypothetical protein AUG07_02020 [Acidobacteria bacterium 13_1_20CM_2_60_10]
MEHETRNGESYVALPQRRVEELLQGRNRLLQSANLLLMVIAGLLVWDTFLKPTPKPAGRFQQTSSPRTALDTKTGKLCSTIDIPYRFKETEVEGAGTFEVPEGWDQTRIQAYEKNFKADDPKAFWQPGKKLFRGEFDDSTNLLPSCASLE